MNRRRRVRVPASSANLGPGYDVLAAALSLGLELEVTETGGELTVECDVPGVALDRSNLCVRAFEKLRPADGLSFRIRSEIPPGAGLGSSAAAIVAGLTAADHMFELDASVFELACELEGHPDNVAAAIYGGFVVCAGGEPARFDPPAGLEGVLATPPGAVPTADARAALPAETPLADAVHNLAHASLLVLGLARGGEPLLRMLGAVVAFTVLAYLFTPLTAAGEEGMPIAFEWNVRYVAPAAAIALALLPCLPDARAGESRRRGVLISLSVLLAVTLASLVQWQQG
ncbi:MAG: homoserine kinase, partial [Thermoleophilaceae bacterium]|nr:homoserine kinase [Thermoleophilaceae bacterium]